jgi:hypothetical protein
MSRRSQLVSALALLEMANGRGHLEQDLATENLREAEIVDNCARILTGSWTRSWADVMEESDVELGHTWPSGATEPDKPISVPLVRHSHPTLCPSPLSKGGTVLPLQDAAETSDTSMQMNRSSYGDDEYTDDDPLSMDTSDTFDEEGHEMTKTIAKEESSHFDLRKHISRSTPLHQLVLLKFTVRKLREQGCIPNNKNDRTVEFQDRIAKQILCRQRPAFYTC